MPYANNTAFARQMRVYTTRRRLKDVSRETYRAWLKTCGELLEWKHPKNITMRDLEELFEALQRFLEGEGRLHWYPDADYEELHLRLSNYAGCNAGRLLVTNGSDDGLALVCQVYLDPGDEVLYPDPGYPAYRASILMAGGIPYNVAIRPENDYLPVFEEIPKIDVHSHVFEDVPEVVEMMDRCRVRIVNVCVRGTDPERLRRQEELAERQQAKYGRNRFPFASTFDVTRRDDPDYVDQVTRWLDASFEKGAVMVKIWKEVGMEIKDRQGRFVLPDDPLFDPVYAFLAKRGKPLLAHLAEPLDAWRPLDPESVHYGYYSKNKEWHLHGRPGFPSHAELVASRDRILERHPRLTVIGAHLGSLEHDVEELARRLERYPNFSVDCSARTADLTRQPPDKVRAFLVRHQDRVLYGLDRSYRPDPQRETTAEDRLRFARELEASYRQDFRYYAGEGEMEYRGKTVRCLGLPRDVLEKLYHRNAERLIPGLD